jgi:ubiquinone/menaquinone biosynthesis C-methylase UbiE
MKLASLTTRQQEISAAGESTEYFRREGTVAEWWDPVSDDDPSFRAWFIAQLDDVMEMVKPAGKNVLDAAAGRGRAVVAAAAAGANSVTALDISAEMLSITAANLAEIPDSGVVTLVRGDLHEMPFPSKSFDAVLLLEVLLHVEDPLTVLRECNRVLEPGGVLAVTTNGANPLERLAQPGKKGPHPASRFRLFMATLVNEVMTSLFGFTWRRTWFTRELYGRFFNAPVRPLYPRTVQRLLRDAGFSKVDHRCVPNRVLPREHRWFATR